jgi:uncharacterized membrane protein
MKQSRLNFFNLRLSKAAILVAAFIFIYLIIFITLALIKYFSYQTYAFDLGIFDQVMWNTLHGRLFESTIIGHNYLGDHFTPALLFLTPFYALFPSPATLLVLQTVLLALGAVPVYWLARDKLGKEAGVVFAAVYLLFPSLQTINMFEFHPIALATTPLLFAFYYLDKGSYKPGLLVLALAMLCQEEVSLVVVMFGIYLAVTKRKWPLAASLVSAGLTWFILTFLVIIPHIRGGPYGYLDRYSYLGHSFSGIIATALTHPGLVAEHVFIKDKLKYLAGLFGPAGFISLFSLSIVLTLTPLAQNTISDYSYQYSLFFQYNATIIPFVMVSAILGTARLASSERIQRLWRRIGVKKLLLGYMLVAALVSNIMISPSPLSLSFYSKSWDLGPITPYYKGSYVIDSHDRTLSRLERLIPPHASLSAAPNLVPHLSKRQTIYSFSYASDSMDYVIIDTKDRTWSQFLEDYRDHAQQLLANPNYGVIAAEDGVVVFKRGSPNKDILPYQRLVEANPQYNKEVIFNEEPVRLLGYDFNWSVDEYGDNLALISLYWQASWRPSQDLRIRLELSHDKKNFVEEHWSGWDIYPSSRWQPGEVVKETYKIRLPARSSPGEYKLLLRLSSYWTALVPANVPSNQGLFPLGTFNLP